MPDNSPSKPEQSSQSGLFPDVVPIQVCSWNECLTGHRWPTTMQTIKCQGCGGTVLAIKKEQCPICNEPCVRMSLRSDHIPRGGGLLERCKGQTSPQAETMDILLERAHWQEAQDGAKFFPTEG